MSTAHDPSASWEPVARHLPFPVGDIAAINVTFVRWLHERSAPDRRIVELWTYCYVNRYFTHKFLARDLKVISVVDELTAKAYGKIRTHMEEVNHPDRFAHWVSVVCRNTFINYTREPFHAQLFEESGEQRLRSRARRNGHARDAATTFSAVDRAIRKLPRFLRATARMWFLDALTYTQISERTGKPVPTIRAYVHKARGRIRKDRAVRRLASEIFEDEPGRRIEPRTK